MKGNMRLSALGSVKTILSIVRDILSTFSRNQRKRISLILFSQILLAGVDLIGVALVGSIGAIAVAGVQSQQPPKTFSRILELLHLGDQRIQIQVAAMAAAATIFFTVRTLLGMRITREMLFYLSHRSADMTKHLISRIFNSGLATIQSRSVQDYLFVITSGMNTLIIGVLSNFILVLSDLSLLIILTAGMIFFSPLITFITIILFTFVGYFLYTFLNQKAEILGTENRILHVKSATKIQEVIFAYRENFIKDRFTYQSDELSKLRRKHSDVLAELNYLPNVTKYSIELFVVLFIFLISAIEFSRTDALHAVATISVFLMASSRIAPAVLRIQQSLLNIQSAVGTSNSSLEILRDFEKYPDPVVNPKLDIEQSIFTPVVEIENLDFGYPTYAELILKQVSLKVEAGLFLAIVGPSGSGKSTLLDLLLGLHRPNSGRIKISGTDSVIAPKVFNGKIGYLPQEIFVINGTVRENVCLGYPAEAFSDEEIWSALASAHATQFVQGMPLGLETLLGEGGMLVSGGEKQRLGIARTLLTDPKLIVMDEATSALDSQTESELTQSIMELRRDRTVIVVAHRLSTVRRADKIIYLNEGRVQAEGTFEELKRQIPNFQAQAELQGL